MGSVEQLNLDLCLSQATNPLDTENNEEAISRLVQLMKDNKETIGFVLRFLGHKIQSPQELEAMKALNVLQALVKRCDKKFTEEIGKFRFLNELIKVISPKYLANRSPEKVKRKIIELLYLWSVELKHEPKIFEAYQMLKKQGIITLDPTHMLPKAYKPMPPPPPRPKDEIWDKEENMLMLKRLIQSGQPEDRAAANKFIKMLAQQADQVAMAKSKVKTELELARNNARLFGEVLANCQSTCDENFTEKDLLNELYESCKALRPKLFKLASEIDEKDSLLNELLEVNDELTKVIAEYDRKIKPVPQSACESLIPSLQNNSNNLLEMNSPTNNETNGASVFNASASPAIASSFAAVGTLAADVGLLSDHITNKEESKISNTQNLPDYHGTLFDLITNVSKPNQNQNQPHQQKNYLKDFLVPSKPDLGMNTGVSLSPSSSSSLSSPNKINVNINNNTSCLDELENLMRQTLNAGPRLENSGDSSMPLNVLKNLADKKINNNHLLSMSLADNRPTEPLVDQLLFNHNDNLCSQATTNESKNGYPSPLADLFVPLESVEPSQRSPVVLVNETELKSILNFGSNKPREDVYVAVLTTTNNSIKNITKIFFHINYPKTMRVKLQAPSATSLPPSNPFLPPSAITQVVLLSKSSNNTTEKLSFRLDYSIGTDNFTKTGEFDF